MVTFTFTEFGSQISDTIASNRLKLRPSWNSSRSTKIAGTVLKSWLEPRGGSLLPTKVVSMYVVSSSATQRFNYSHTYRSERDLMWGWPMTPLSSKSRRPSWRKLLHPVSLPLKSQFHIDKSYHQSRLICLHHNSERKYPVPYLLCSSTI